MGRVFEVDENVLDLVAKSLNYPSVKALREDVKILKEWMKTQKHLPEIMGDKLIENFLIQNKGSVELSKEKIDMYYTVRSLLPEVFDNNNPKLPKMQKVAKAVYFLVLPQMTREMYRVIFWKIRDKNLFQDVDAYSLIGFKANYQEIRLAEDVTYGDVFIYDFENLAFNHIFKFSPSSLYKMLVVIYERVFSMRIKAVYIINAPSFIEKILNVIKEFVKPKIFDRIHVLQDSSYLFKYFDKKQIPRDYGGEEMSIDELQDLVNRKLDEYQDRFDKLDTLRVNEDLRPEVLRNDEDLGYYGNFKNLAFD